MKKARISFDQIPPFKDLPVKKRKEFESSAAFVELRSRERLFDIGASSDRVFFLTSGGLKLHRRAPGSRNYIADFIAPGVLFGLTDKIAGKSRSIICTAMQPSTLYCWSASEFFGMIDSHSAGAKAITKLLANRINSDMEKLEEQAVDVLRERLIKLIHRLAKDYGQKIKGGTLINLKVTHQDMADHLGASRESVTVTISQLRKQKLVRLDVRRIIVPDMRALLRG